MNNEDDDLSSQLNGFVNFNRNNESHDQFENFNNYFPPKNINWSLSKSIFYKIHPAHLSYNLNGIRAPPKV